ncbi:MAG: penicillin acylase family protein [Limnohabitans sp.]
MKWIARLVVALVVGVLTVGGVVAVQTLHRLPRLDGELPLAGLSQAVQVRRDAADVTHIEGSTALDVWRALGFVHAQERGWQLEFNRRLMRGELSDILGPSTLDTDKLMRTLGIIHVARAQLQNLSPQTREALQAYSEGIVQAHSSGAAGRSPEFRLLGTRAGGASGQAWTPEDSVGWSLMMALDLGGNWGNEFARFSALQVLPTERLWQFMPPYPGEPPATRVDLAALYKDLGAHASTTPIARTNLPETTALAQWSTEWVRDLGTLDGKGSNNWVIHASRSASGKPLLANDPHLALSSPAIWYFVRLKAPAGRLAGQDHPALDVVGATLPGMPFVVLGRTRGVAWGFTNTGPDVQDLYLEQLDPSGAGRYRTPQGWAPFDVRKESIQVKGQGAAEITVRHSRHGPIVSDVQPQYQGVLNTARYAMALRWSALEADNRSLDAALAANWSNSVGQLLDAYAAHHSPMQSVVMADTQGEVAFKAIGKMPMRSPFNDLRGVAPAPGWLAAYDWTGWLPYEQTPTLGHAAIAQQGWHATANQNILAPGYPHFLGADWTTPERYHRIAALLTQNPVHNLASMAQVQQDVLSLGALALLPHARQVRTAHPLDAQSRELLAKFDGRMERHSAAALVLNVWAHELTRDLIGSQLGNARFMALYGKRHLRSGLLGILERQDAFWCGPSGCAVRARQAMERTLDQLSQQLGSDPVRWRWDKWHVALSSHKPFGKVPVLHRIFDERVGSAGDLFTVNVGQYWANDPREPFANRHAASMRVVYDLADLEQSRFIYQTGQSGDPASNRSRDMAQSWSKGVYRPLQLDPARYSHALRLHP